MRTFVDANPSLFFKKNDPEDVRLGEFVKNKLQTKPSLTILGYPDDEGILRNGGRPGAALAPDTIRKYFYKMTPSPFAKATMPLIDLGNLNVAEISEIEDRHTQVETELKKLFKNNHKLLTFGGGHDYGYPDGSAFVESFKNPLVINFDAHFDVRPLDHGITSGTPFFRLLEKKAKFDFVEVGIQSQCASRHHYDYLKKKKAEVLSFDDFLTSKKTFSEWALKQLSKYLKKSRPTFLSLDIDVFSSAFAPGASQSWPIGVDPAEFIKLLDLLYRKLDIRMLGIYEVSPPLDIDDRTSKLAAQIAYHFWTLHV